MLASAVHDVSCIVYRLLCPRRSQFRHKPLRDSTSPLQVQNPLYRGDFDDDDDDEIGALGSDKQKVRSQQLRKLTGWDRSISRRDPIARSLAETRSLDLSPRPDRSISRRDLIAQSVTETQSLNLSPKPNRSISRRDPIAQSLAETRSLSLSPRPDRTISRRDLIAQSRRDLIALSLTET